MVAASRKLWYASGRRDGTPICLWCDVVSVALAVFGRMAADEPIAGAVVDEAGEQAFTFLRWSGSDFRGGWSQAGPGRRTMLRRRSGADAGQDSAHPCARSPLYKEGSTGFCRYDAGKGQTADRSASRGRIWFAREIEAHEFGLNSLDIFEFQKQIKDGSDGQGFGFIDGEGPVLSVIADGYPASHPHALLLGRGDLVADPLTRDFALELRKGQKDIEGKAAH